jgi:uncharacterized protein YneF (UPF0154 family)
MENKPNISPETARLLLQKMGQLNPTNRTLLGEIGRGALQSLTGIADIPALVINLPTYAEELVSGKEIKKLPYLSEYVDKKLEKARGVEGNPTTAQNVARNFTSFVGASPVGKAAIASKAVPTAVKSVAKYFTPSNKKEVAQLLTAGTASTAAQEALPDNPIANIGATILGSKVGGTFADLHNVKKGSLETIARLTKFNPWKYEASLDAGITPMLAEVSDAKPVKAIHNLFAELPGSSHVIEKAGLGRADQLDDIKTNVLKNHQTIGKEEGSDLLGMGAKSYNKKASDVAYKIYSKAWKGFNSKEDVEVPKTLELLNDMFNGLSPDALEIVKNQTGGKLLYKLWETIKSDKLPLANSYKFKGYKNAKAIDYITGKPLIKDKIIDKDLITLKNVTNKEDVTKSQYTNFNKIISKHVSPSDLVEGKNIGRSGKIPFGELKNVFKSNIDDLVDSWNSVGNREQGVLKNISQTLKTEMRDFVKTKNPKAAKYFAKGDEFWKSFSEKNRLITNAAGEQSKKKDSYGLFDNVLNKAKRGNVRPMKVLSQRLDPASKTDLSVTYNNEIGLNQEKEFNLETWGRNFRKLPANGQDAFISGYPSELQPKIKNIAEVLKNSDSVKMAGNPSRTAYILALWQIASNAVKAAPGLGLSYLGAKKFTDPEFVGALYKISKAKTPEAAKQLYTAYSNAIISQDKSSKKENKPNISPETARMLLQKMGVKD